MIKSKQNLSKDKLIQQCIKNELLQNIIKKSVKKAVDEKFRIYAEEKNNLLQEIQDIQKSQKFISEKYDNLHRQYSKLVKAHDEPNKELKSANLKLTEIKRNVETDNANLEKLNQYGRRENLEFHGVPVTANEDVTKLEVEISELLAAVLNQSDVSIAHRLLPKNVSNQNSNKEGKPESVTPPIIARFVNRTVCNEIYKNRKQAKNN